MASSVFTIDISETHLKLIQFEAAGNGTYALQSLHVVDAEPTFFKSEQQTVRDAQSARIKALISQSQAKSTNVNIIVPDSETYSRILEMPQLHEKELLSAIKYQADQFIPMPLDEVNISIEVVYENKWNKKNLILIVAAPQKMVQITESTVEQAGVLPLRLENEVSAVNRACKMLFTQLEDRQEDGEGYIIINMANASSSFYFFDQCKHAVTHTHSFPIGYSLFLKELEINLNIVRPEARRLLETSGALSAHEPNTGQILLTLMKQYLQELEKSINTVKQSKARINGIFLINSANDFYAFDRLIAKYTGLPCEMLDVSPFFTYEAEQQITGAQLAHFIIAMGAQLP